MPKMYIAYAVLVAALIGGIAASLWPHYQVAPVVVASPPPLPQPRPKPAMHVKAPRPRKPKAAALDCADVRWAKQNLSADTLKTLAASHPAQAQAAKECQ